MTRSNNSSALRAPRSKMLHASTQQIVALLLLCLSLTSPLLADTIIAPSTPSRDGEETFRVELANGTFRLVFVTGITKGMTTDQKATAIQDAFNLAGFGASVTPQHTVNVGQTLGKITGVIQVSTSGETDKVSFTALLPTDLPVFAQVDLHLGPTLSTFTDLAGINSDGAAASYTAGFEFISPSLGNISLFTNLGFSDLTTPTLTGLLQQEFDLLRNQLQVQAPSLVSGLSLNLPEGAIVFQPFGVFTSASATNGTTDVALVSTISVSTVPEPSTLILFGFGLIGLAAWGRRKINR